MSQAQPPSLNDFWEESEEGPWQIDYEVHDEDDHLVSRRQAMSGLAGLIGLVGAGTLNVMLGSTVARADVASGGLSIAGDSTTSDGGNLNSLTVDTAGHVSYDGLDVDAASIAVNFYAAHTGGDLTLTGNQIAGQNVNVVDDAGLDTRAGHYDYTFSGVDVLSSNDISKTDFHVTTDGDTQSFNVDFRIELQVLDGSGTQLISGDAVTTTTITVTNETRSAGAGGSGNTSASGNNQSPGGA